MHRDASPLQPLSAASTVREYLPSHPSHRADTGTLGSLQGLPTALSSRVPQLIHSFGLLFFFSLSPHPPSVTLLRLVLFLPLLRVVGPRVCVCVSSPVQFSSGAWKLNERTEQTRHDKNSRRGKARHRLSPPPKVSRCLLSSLRVWQWCEKTAMASSPSPTIRPTLFRPSRVAHPSSRL